MPGYSVWLEGYRCTGNSGTAQIIGTAMAETFADACRKVACKVKGRYGRFDPEKLTFWGCRAFPTRQEAGQLFG